MSIKVSSGISLSTNYFLRNFYTNNQKAAKTSGRSGYSNVELSYEDSRALNRAAKRLSKSDFGSDTDEKDDDLMIHRRLPLKPLWILTIIRSLPGNPVPTTKPNVMSSSLTR